MELHQYTNKISDHIVIVSYGPMYENKTTRNAEQCEAMIKTKPHLELLGANSDCGVRKFEGATQRVNFIF